MNAARGRNGSSHLDWADVEAPGLEEFERIAARAFASLPERFREMCADLLIRIADFADEETLEELGIESEYGLLGLFIGTGLPEAGEVRSGQMPNMIFLYRRAILDYWAEHEETLGAVIVHVFVHEIGHHFGLSDDDMERIEQDAAP